MKRVSELIEWELDYWTAKAEGYILRRVDIEDIHEQKIYRKPDVIQHGWLVFDKPPLNFILIGSIPDRENSYFNVKKFSPSTQWEDGGPIIKRNFIELAWNGDPSECKASWMYNNGAYSWQYGPDPLTAAMRCYVGAKFGEEVDDSQTHNL